MLDLRGILSFVYADIGPPPLELGQDVRILPEDAAGEDHLVVIIHFPAAEEIVLVFEVNPWKIYPLYLVGVDLLLGQHHVLAVRDMGAGVFDLEVAGERRSGAGEQVTDHTVDLPLIIQ